MAKLLVELDTETQEISVSVDGRPITNIDNLSIYNYGSTNDPGYHFDVTSYKRNGDVSEMTRLAAKNSVYAKEAVATGTAKASSVEGYVEFPCKTKAQEQFSYWFSATRGRN